MTAKIVALHPTKAAQPQSEFISTYGDKTADTYAKFLDQVYQAYVKTPGYQYLSFREKVNVEYQYQSLRRFLMRL